MNAGDPDPYRGASRARLVSLLREERDPATLGRWTRHPAWQVRHQAIQSLGATASAEAESPLLEALQTSTDPFDLAYASASLSRVGTAASIPALARLIDHPVEDVKTSAINAIAAVGGPAEMPLFLRALADRSWVAKWYAMAAIHRHGDLGAIDAVIRRLRAMLSRERKTRIAGWTELMYAVDYLRRWEASDPRVSDVLRWVRRERWHRLSDEERTWWESSGLEG